LSRAASARPRRPARENPGLPTKPKDKSKPIRVGIEAWYARNSDAMRRKDIAAVMALRTADFHTLTPDGKTNTRGEMEAYTRRLFDMIDRFLTLEFEVGTIDLRGEIASADVRQRTVRKQRMPDGQIHEVDASVTQKEHWKMTPDGWKLWRVDGIRDQQILVDDRAWKPGR
jgi:ketosteroid isomerase-like protein